MQGCKKGDQSFDCLVGVEKAGRKKVFSLSMLMSAYRLTIWITLALDNPKLVSMCSTGSCFWRYHLLCMMILIQFPILSSLLASFRERDCQFLGLKVLLMSCKLVCMSFEGWAGNFRQQDHTVCKGNPCRICGGSHRLARDDTKMYY